MLAIENRRSESPREGQRAVLKEEIREINKIFGRPHVTDSSRHTQDRYAREAPTGLAIVVNQIKQWPNKAA